METKPDFRGLPSAQKTLHGHHCPLQDGHPCHSWCSPTYEHRVAKMPKFSTPAGKQPPPCLSPPGRPALTSGSEVDGGHLRPAAALSCPMSHAFTVTSGCAKTPAANGKTEAETQSHTKEKGARLTSRPVALCTTLVLRAGLTPNAKKRSSPSPLCLLFCANPQRQLRAK